MNVQKLIKMSTRANIKLKDHEHTVYFYSHYDGYPSGVGNDLKLILNEVGWDSKEILYKLLDDFEITSCIHGDIEFLYEFDCDNKQLTCMKVDDVKSSDEIVGTFLKDW